MDSPLSASTLTAVDTYCHIHNGWVTLNPHTHTSHTHPQITNQLVKAREQEQAGGAADEEDEDDEESCESEAGDAVAKSTKVHNINHKGWLRLRVLAEEYDGERGENVSGSFVLLDDSEASDAGVAYVTPTTHNKSVPKKIRRALSFKKRV